MTNKEELEILRNLLWKIGYAAMSSNNKKISDIISEIRYGYCYNQSNSYEGQTFEDIENLRIDSLKRLNEI